MCLENYFLFAKLEKIMKRNKLSSKKNLVFLKRNGILARNNPESICQSVKLGIISVSFLLSGERRLALCDSEQFNLEDERRTTRNARL